jgi:hypothetical protein
MLHSPTPCAPFTNSRARSRDGGCVYRDVPGILTDAPLQKLRTTADGVGEDGVQ